jgi:phosphoribosylanthranilate isomerase
MKYPDNILEVHSYQIIWDLSFGKKSSRYFDGIIPTLPGSIKVGVLLMKHYYYQKVLKHDLQVVQLHGKESVDFCQELQVKVNYKVFSIQDEFDFSALKPFEEFLFSI